MTVSDYREGCVPREPGAGGGDELHQHYMMISLCCSFLITVIARIPNPFMLRLNMSLEISLVCSFIITLITEVLVFHV